MENTQHTKAGPNVQVRSFEPMPPLYECLQRNVREGHDRCLNVGVGSRSGRLTMDYLPNYSLLSGVGASANANLYEEVARNNNVQADVKAAFESVSYEVDVVALAYALKDIVDSNEVISIIKIDVEGMEKEVVDGIDDKLWACIRQVVLEVHDVDDRIESIKRILECKGFDVRQSELTAPSFLLGNNITADSINTCLVTGFKRT